MSLREPGILAWCPSTTTPSGCGRPAAAAVVCLYTHGQHGDQLIVMCLDDQVRAELSKHFPLHAELLLICRDKALDDTAAANLALQCRLKTI